MSLLAWNQAAEYRYFLCPQLNGGGIEQASAVEAINTLFLQGQEGFLRFFPMWPVRIRRARCHCSWCTARTLYQYPPALPLPC